MEEQGNAIPNINRLAGSPNFVFDLKNEPGAAVQYLLNVNSEHPIIVPARVLTTDALYADVNLQNIITSLYLGVLAVMFLYNLFLFFATKDNSYLYYVAYIFLLAFAQTTFTGYEAKYFWPGNPGLNKYAVVVTSTLSSIAGLCIQYEFPAHPRTRAEGTPVAAVAGADLFGWIGRLSFFKPQPGLPDTEL
jgi:two-component system NtrC family sensor kinase